MLVRMGARGTLLSPVKQVRQIPVTQDIATRQQGAGRPGCSPWTGEIPEMNDT